MLWVVSLKTQLFLKNLKSYATEHQKINFFSLKIASTEHSHKHSQSINLFFVNSSHAVKEEVCLLFLILFCFWQNFTNSRSWQNTDIFSDWLLFSNYKCKVQLRLFWSAGLSCD